MTKRLIDIVVASALLIVLSPVFVGIAVAVLAIDGRPVLFRQVRPGYHAKSFVVLKFRSMASTTEKDGSLIASADRLTSLGRFLRGLSLDELPQLVNVLRGEMSLVGPRPLLVEYLPYYTEREAKRHDVRPGITGLAQVSGRNFLPWDKRLELDVQYVETQSLVVDLKILLLTVQRVARRRDVAVPGTVSEKLSDERQRLDALPGGQGPF